MHITREHLKNAREIAVSALVLMFLGIALERGYDPKAQRERAEGMIAAAELQGQAMREPTRDEVIARAQYHD